VKLALAIVALAASTAVAQPMAAMKGTPLPAADLPVGTISVRVVAGNISTTVPGIDVTLAVNGTPRQARTDDEGRAFFKDLPVGAKVQATIQGEDKTDVTSEEFDVPSASGVKLMLSTRPPAGGMGGAPFAGGEGGMPDPRKISGQPRPEQNDPAGDFTIRLTYDDLKEKTPPAGVPVTLVGYAADNSISVVTVASGTDGRAQFTNLDRSGATAYYGVAMIPRGGGFDRVMTQPLVLVPQVGARALLSADKRDSTAAPIDDLGNDGADAGKIRISIDGAGDMTTKVALVDVATRKPLATVPVQPGPPDPTQIQGSAPFEAHADLPAGTLDVEVTGGPGSTTAAMPNVGVKLVPGDAQTPPADAPQGTTDLAGKVRVVAPKAGAMRAIISMNGRDIPTDVFDLGTSGGVLHVEAHWPEHGKPEAMIDFAGTPGEVVYAEATWHGQPYRSRPFQLEPGRGAHLTIAILPRVMFEFSWSSKIDDSFLAVQGNFAVYNNSWIPYIGDDDGGVLVPLPAGHKGAVLAEQDQSDVAVSQGEGFRIVRPLAPGGRKFLGGFSVPVEHGAIDWHLDLPYGALQSGIEIQQVPGMNVKVPEGVTGRVENDSRGSWYVLAPISILPKQSMTMTITGLPSAPSWTRWVPGVLGLLVVAGLLTGLVLAMVLRRGKVASTRGVRRQKLLDELVDLERREGSASDPARREKLLAELEQLWEQE
jgi:hypothetical protein